MMSLFLRPDIKIASAGTAPGIETHRNVIGTLKITQFSLWIVATMGFSLFCGVSTRET